MSESNFLEEIDSGGGNNLEIVKKLKLARRQLAALKSMSKTVDVNENSYSIEEVDNNDNNLEIVKKLKLARRQLTTLKSMVRTQGEPGIYEEVKEFDAQEVSPNTKKGYRNLSKLNTQPIQPAPSPGTQEVVKKGPPEKDRNEELNEFKDEIVSKIDKLKTTKDTDV